MRIILSNHAIMRAKQRNISFEQITDCILNPDKVQPEPNGTICYKKLQTNKHLLLTYTTSESSNTVKVVTVILTSQITKYFTI
ncbi:MAG: DUF4258 domain-containing protein [Cytophagaceae bacterium]|nr:DUF4258 domain-containing protein [Cytophagaceae bacterium]